MYEETEDAYLYDFTTLQTWEQLFSNSQIEKLK